MSLAGSLHGTKSHRRRGLGVGSVLPAVPQLLWRWIIPGCCLLRPHCREGGRSLGLRNETSCTHAPADYFRRRGACWSFPPFSGKAANRLANCCRRETQAGWSIEARRCPNWMVFTTSCRRRWANSARPLYCWASSIAARDAPGRRVACGTPCCNPTKSH